MWRKPAFWGAFILATVLATAFAVLYFPSAFPLVTLDLKMDRQQALARGAELAGVQRWGPSGYREAASFRLDSTVQRFVELEAGGTAAFRRLLAEGRYCPYTWQVRHFKQGEVRETLIRFTPAGQPYGFVEKLPEGEPGPSLAPVEARPIAEATALEAWGIDLGRYERVETSKELRPGGRTDHAFVYRLRQERLGDGEYRLRLVVGGDRLTELTHFVKVPEAFDRRYREMRSANETIASGALVVAMAVYLVGGCVVGLFFLLRRREAVWRPPLLWGFGISLMQVLATLNQWPLIWMDYDTALSTQAFALRQVVLLLLEFLGFGVLYCVSFMGAEGLSRKAFPHHLQLWRMWSPSVASSRTVLGYSAAGILLVAVFFAYEVVLHFVSQRILGWWTPSDALFDPDVLASYFPWLTSIAISMQAGFWEECLFRAVPLAAAALLGQRFGKRGWWIAAALVLQALVFGAGHANYPNQPAYARLVELVIPSLGFGFLYLRFGLLPAIILHYAYDAVWIGLPLFVSAAPGVWVDQLMVTLLTLLPLWVVLAARVRSGAWTEVPETELNGAWSPPPFVPVSAPQETPTTPVLPRALRLGLPVAGIAGLLLWGSLAEFSSDVPALEVGRSAAVAEARRELATRGFELGPEWRALADVSSAAGLEDRFVWQEGGQERYQRLLGTYLSPPRWRIRFVRFSGDVAERAEEYQVYLSGGGQVDRFRHLLPEGRAGSRLTEEEAAGLAEEAIRAELGVEIATLEPVSVIPSHQPERDDWELTYRDPGAWELEDGEARAVSEVAGSEVADVYRFVHVPEEWTRRDRDRATTLQALRALGWIATGALLLAGLVGGIVRWSRRLFSVRTFIGFAVLLSLVGIVELANSWPSLEARFETTQPYSLQASVAAGFGVVALLIWAASVGLVIGFVHAWTPPGARLDRGPRVILGGALGVTLAALLTAAASLGPSVEPTWPSFATVATFLPLVGEAIGPLSGFVVLTALFLLIFAAAHHFSAGWRRRRVPLGAALVLVGFALSGAASVESVADWAISGVATGAVLLAAYLAVLRYELALLPVATGVLIVLGGMREGVMQAHSAALPGAILGALPVIALALGWSEWLAREEPRSPTSSGAAEGEAT